MTDLKNGSLGLACLNALKWTIAKLWRFLVWMVNEIWFWILVVSSYITCRWDISLLPGLNNAESIYSIAGTYWYHPGFGARFAYIRFLTKMNDDQISAVNVQFANHPERRGSPIVVMKSIAVGEGMYCRVIFPVES